MPNRTTLPNETIMYSIHPQTGAIITHRLPWVKDSPQLEHYVAKGFIYERPEEKVIAAPAKERRQYRKKVKV